MLNYKAPIRDIRFVLEDVLDFYPHYDALENIDNPSADVVNAVIEEAGKFCSQVLAPINQSGDREGCQWNDGVVTTPEGFKEAYQQYVEGGWPSLSKPVEFGGQGLPESLSTVVGEMIGSSNWSWSVYPGLSQGCMRTLIAHGTEDQQQRFLPKLVEGSWTGTMCLTEPHCGTDLGMLRTKAEPNADGSFSITGTKIFISSGEHDMSENIVHIVLARLPDAPGGTKGISLFLVPKFIVNEPGEVGERNSVQCGSIEHKMGIHGNATCVMNFDGATGYQIGPDHRGLQCMFTFMNHARLAIGMQGLCHAELGYQNALAYALDRIQGRSLSGPKAEDKPADPIIVHADVRRMLLTQKSLGEGCRFLIYLGAKYLDEYEYSGSDEQKQSADAMLSFLTPIIKGFSTEAGFECANLALQCLGGHGYIAEWGLEQNLRDSRIGMIYEGTNGVQSLDLLGRKVLGDRGEVMRIFTKQIHLFCKENAEVAELKPWIEQLAKANKGWGDLSMQVGMKAMQNQDEVGAASFDFLMYSGYVTLGYLWAVAAKAALDQLAAGTSETEFYQDKLDTAKFYFQRMLPRTHSLAATIVAGSDALMSPSEASLMRA